MAMGNIFLIALSIVCLCGVANAQLNIVDATKVGLAPAADCKANAAVRFQHQLKLFRNKVISTNIYIYMIQL